MTCSTRARALSRLSDGPLKARNSTKCPSSPKKIFSPPLSSAETTDDGQQRSLRPRAHGRNICLQDSGMHMCYGQPLNSTSKRALICLFASFRSER